LSCESAAWRPLPGAWPPHTCRSSGRSKVRARPPKNAASWEGGFVGETPPTHFVFHVHALVVVPAELRRIDSVADKDGFGVEFGNSGVLLLIDADKVVEPLEAQIAGAEGG